MVANPDTSSNNNPLSFVHEYVNCTICGIDNTLPLYSISLQKKTLSCVWVNGERVSVHETATVVACQQCGLQYINPRLVFDASTTTYTETMEQQYFTSTYAVRQRTYQHLISQLPRWLGRDVKRLLDVGCGDGVLLAAASTAGIACAGTEVSENLRQLLQKKYEGHIEISSDVAAMPDHSFDVITLINVIEHLREPYEFLSILYDKLTSSGILLIHTPNVGGLPARLKKAQWSQIEPLEHLYYFSESTLGSILQKSGFEPCGRFHLGVSSGIKNTIQSMLGAVGLYLDNGLGIVARRKVKL